MLPPSCWIFLVRLAAFGDVPSILCMSSSSCCGSAFCQPGVWNSVASCWLCSPSIRFPVLSLGVMPELAQRVEKDLLNIMSSGTIENADILKYYKGNIRIAVKPRK
ncbi:uncharacterized protein LOC123225104 [Mangifera indica]|uniref:uncharacterized protein LOC123225104 n=1 Tax=Mangifera indica TaxID=29780 RepID=UPI001CF93DC9|nr:uncharacterized protein LOC123225104 [Mangifera indica]